MRPRYAHFSVSVVLRRHSQWDALSAIVFYLAALDFHAYHLAKGGHDGAVFAGAPGELDLAADT